MYVVFTVEMRFWKYFFEEYEKLLLQRKDREVEVDAGWVKIA